MVPLFSGFPSTVTFPATGASTSPLLEHPATVRRPHPNRKAVRHQPGCRLVTFMDLTWERGQKAWGSRGPPGDGPPRTYHYSATLGRNSLMPRVLGQTT